MTRYDMILWDVDQTLLDFKASESYAVKHCFALYEKNASEELIARYSRINESFWKRIEKGEIDKKEALVGRFATLFQETGIRDLDPAAFQEQYAQALGSVYFFQDGSYELVKELKGEYRQYLITNGVSRTQRSKLKLSGLDTLVDGIFVSEEIGFPKPQKEYFERCFSMIPDFKKERALIVGDSLTSDILGGNNAGVAACWYNPKGLKNDSEARADYEIRHLREVLPILRGED